MIQTTGLNQNPDYNNRSTASTII